MANGISLDNSLNQNIIEQFITPKSAVQRLDETKANYVKSDNVLINDLNQTKSIELINKIIDKSDNLIINDLENSAIKTNSQLNEQINNQLNNSIHTDKIQSNNNNNYLKNFNQQLKSKEDCLLNSLLNCEYNRPLTSIILSNNLNKKFNSNQSNQFLNNNHKINSPIKYRKHLNKDNRKQTNQINLETQLIKLICIDQNEEELPNFTSSLPSSSNSERLSNCSRPSSICSSPISSSLITKKNSSILNKPLPKPPILNSKDAIKLQKKSTNKSILSTSIQTVNSKLPSIVSKTSKAILSTKFPSALKVCSKVNSKVCSKLNSVNSKLSKSTSCLRISSQPPKELELKTQQITKSTTELNSKSIQATKNQLNQNNKIINNDLTINSKLTSQNDKELNTIKNVLSLNENIDLKQPVLIEKVENQQSTVKSNLPITPVINRNLKDKLNEHFLKPKKDVPIVASITKNELKTTNQLNNLENKVNKQIIENNEFRNDVKIDLAKNELMKINLQSSLNCCLENNNLKDHELRICLNCSKIEKEFKNLKIQPVCLNKTSTALKEELKNLNNQINQFINEQKTIELDNLKQSLPVSRSKSDVSHRLNRIINQTKFNTIGLDSSLIYKLNLNHQQQQHQNQYLINNNLSTSNTNLYNSAIYKPFYQTNYQMSVNHLNKNSNQPYLSNSQLYCNQSTVDSYYTLDSSNAPKQQQLMYTAEFINGKNDYWINDKQNDFKHQFTIDNSKINRLELNNNNKQSIQSSFKNEKSSLVNPQTNQQLNNLQNATNLITNIADPNLTIQFNSINLTDTTANKFNNNIKFINQTKQLNSNNLITKPLIPENDLDTGEISIIERNARVIKWLYQNKKYYDNSV